MSDSESTAGPGSGQPKPPVVEQTDESLAAFAKAMQDVYVRAKKEAGYNASYYLSMLQESGALETARQLLANSTVSSGFTALWERKRLDLTVENVVLQPQFRDLFSDEELETARERLEQYGYRPD